ncbi:hypothetical protein [Sphingobium abikonense]|uniref:hypothetical protein n=1 Tax=Sphingobium abikonense TaxID=86193 RepID=UPI000A4D6EFB|nr:hypothetical protein [Sphingobium abikonense]
MRLWMLSCGTVAAAAAMGLTLGSYAISPQRSPLDQPDEEPISTDFSAAPVAMPDAGPQVIHCTGCGPTLADRRYAADMAGYDSYAMVDGDSSDPVVRDYMAQDYDAADYAMHAQDSTDDGTAMNTAPIPTIHQLPPNVVRFADSPSAAERTEPPVAQRLAHPALRVAMGDAATSAASPRSAVVQPVRTQSASAY